MYANIQLYQMYKVIQNQSKSLKSQFAIKFRTMINFVVAYLH